VQLSSVHRSWQLMIDDRRQRWFSPAETEMLLWKRTVFKLFLAKKNTSFKLARSSSYF
jgi:hypothetical protein